MGATQSKLSEEQIQQLEECSYFRRHEIIQLDAYFRSISKGRDTIAKEAFKEIPELRYNPFRERIACIFSSDDGQINFDDFVDFFSVFSTRATREIKSFYAFRIYDANEDGYLEKNDILKLIKAITLGLSEEEMDTIAEKIFEEADIDGDQRLSYLEFEHITSRTPDFPRRFVIPLGGIERR